MRLGQTSIVHFFSQVGTTVIGAVATIYFARELGPATLGTYFIVIALLTWAQLAANLGVQTALTKRMSEGGEPGAYISATIIIQTSLFIVVAGTIWLFQPFVDQYIGSPLTEEVILLLSVQLLFGIISAVLRGQHTVHISAGLRPIERSIRTLIQVALVVFGFGIIGLVAGHIISTAVASIVGASMVVVKLSRPRRIHFVELWNFARYSWLSQLTGNTFNSIDTIILAFFVSSTLIGIYEVAWNVASILAVFGASIAQTLFPEMSKMAAEGARGVVAELLEKSLRFTGLFTIPGIAGAALVGDLVLKIYGPDFSQGHLTLIILVFARLLFIYEGQFVTTLDALDRPDLTFRVNAIFIVTDIILNLALIPKFGWIGAAVATAIAAAAALVLSHLLVSRLISISIPWDEIGKQTAAAMMMTLFILALRWKMEDTYLNLSVFIISGVTIYFIILVILSVPLREVIFDNIRN